MLIGITGTNGSGKGELSKILSIKGFIPISLGEESRKEARDNGMEPTRENLQKLWELYSKEERESFIQRRVLPKIEKNKNYVIDGIRCMQDLEMLRKLDHFVLISIDSPLDLRWERVRLRNREGDAKNFDDFIKQDNFDKGILKIDNGPETLRCMKEAEYFIINNGSLEDLKNKVLDILKELKC